MTERAVYKLLAGLEGRILTRRSTPGKCNSYQFIGLDTPELRSPVTPEHTFRATPEQTPEQTPEPREHAIRKEPVYEPVEREGAPDLPPLQLARGLLERMELTRSEGNMRACAFAIEAVAQARGSPFPNACDWLLGRAVAARKRGDSVNRWWFEEGMQKWESNGNGQVSKSEQRSNTRRANIAHAFGANLDGNDGRSGREREAGTKRQPDAGIQSRILKASTGSD